jgi:predicted lipid-binding transport protein (Tim44 family)
MTEENAQSTADTTAEASARKGGTQFIIKMIFLGLIVLAIVFYVRSLDHKAPATAMPSPEATAPIAAEEPSSTVGETSATAHTATPPVTADGSAPAEAAAPPAADEAAVADEVTPPAATEPGEEPRFRPMTDEEVMRQIQEVFAPETLAQPSGN